MWCQQRNWENLTKTPSISLCFLHPTIHSNTEWSDRSKPGTSLWSFCDSSVTLFKVKWPPTRGFKGHFASPGISQSYLCLLPTWLLAVCVLVKVSQGSQNLGGLAFWATTVHCATSLCQLLQRQRQAGLSSLTACLRASRKTRSRNLSLVSIVSVNIEHWRTEYVCCTRLI